jgi:hypothetical protein
MEGVSEEGGGGVDALVLSSDRGYSRYCHNGRICVHGKSSRSRLIESSVSPQ